MYDELAGWWPLLSAPAVYAEEAEIYRRLLASAGDRPPQTVLELGSGGGTNASLTIDGAKVSRTGTGNGPIAALLNILHEDGVDVRVLDYSEHALSEGGNAMAAAYVECAVGERVLWGVGIDANTSMSSLKAVISAVNRAIRDAQA